MNDIRGKVIATYNIPATRLLFGFISIIFAFFTIAFIRLLLTIYNERGLNWQFTIVLIGLFISSFSLISGIIHLIYCNKITIYENGIFRPNFIRSIFDRKFTSFFHFEEVIKFWKLDTLLKSDERYFVQFKDGRGRMIIAGKWNEEIYNEIIKTYNRYKDKNY